MYGRGAFYTGRRRVVRRSGLYRRENVGMSSESRVRIPAAENPRFPEEGSSAQGKSGPKPRTKVVGDGQLVEIPVPPKAVMSDALTQEEESSVPLVEHVQAPSGGAE